MVPHNLQKNMAGRTNPLGRVPNDDVVFRRDAEGAHDKVRDRVAPLRGEREAVAVDNRSKRPTLSIVRQLRGRCSRPRVRAPWPRTS